MAVVTSREAVISDTPVVGDPGMLVTSDGAAAADEPDVARAA
jgi:hypothetical protein